MQDPFILAGNPQRAGRGASIVVAYRDAHDAGEPLYTALTDLLADLRHYCAVGGIDYDECAMMAERHYSAEVQGRL